MKLIDKVKKLPDKSGIYKFKNARGEVVYIGKAASLRKRVISYLRHPQQLTPRTALMVASVTDIDYQVTGSESEALILEYNLIKKYRPHYNIRLRDDKKYPFVKVTTGDSYPRLFMTRVLKLDGSSYYGPYTSAAAVRKTLKLLRKVFPVRSCNLNIIHDGKSRRERPCLDYDLNICTAPCIGLITAEEYSILIRGILLFLQGKVDILIGYLEKKMQTASSEQLFEQAAEYRDLIEAVKKLAEEQKFASLRDKEPGYEIEKWERADVSDFSFLSTTKFAAMRREAILELQRVLGLSKPPWRIEAFDISNLGGSEAVGSLVVFERGLPERRLYRYYRIRLSPRIDDCAMMGEVIERRYRRIREGKQQIPDLILIDGGKAQLNVACSRLQSLKLSNLPVIGLAKRFEHVYLFNRSEPFILAPRSPVLILIQHIRDEAHRFALRLHRRLRLKKGRTSILDSISGIGPKRKQRLFNYYQSVQEMKKAGTEELQKVAGISLTLARELRRKLEHSGV